jgi:hypothetical protein
MWTLLFWVRTADVETLGVAADVFAELALDRLVALIAPWAPLEPPAPAPAPLVAWDPVRT